RHGRDHRRRARSAAGRIPRVRHRDAGHRLRRPARHHLQPLLAAARRRGARARRGDRGGGVHSAAHPEPGGRPVPGHPPPRGARAVRGNRCAGAGRVRGDGHRLARARRWAPAGSHRRPGVGGALRSARRAGRLAGRHRGAAVTQPATRPPYRAAVAVTLLVLAGYLLTLAPSVTFWDAGEFIAAAKVLGIPHPPGTPLFVMIAHVWAMLVPVGEFAARTNLLSALLSAGAAGFLFLVAHESMRDFEPRLRLLGAAAGAVLAGFGFTNWQNSNETEVYAVATFTIAAMSWLALLWRRRRDEPRAGRLLLLVVYLAGISIDNHLLALLAGPAVLAFLVATLRADPAPDPAARRAEWGQVAVIAGLWALLIGTGLGSTRLAGLGALCFLAAAVYAARG